MLLRAGGRPEPKSQIGIRQQVDAPIDLPNGRGRLRHLHWTGGRHLVPLILLPFERAFEAKGGVPGDHRAPRLRRLIHRHFHRRSHHRSHHLRRHLVSPKVRPFADPATALTARNQDTWASLPWSLAGRTREGLNNFGHWVVIYDGEEPTDRLKIPTNWNAKSSVRTGSLLLSATRQPISASSNLLRS